MPRNPQRQSKRVGPPLHVTRSPRSGRRGRCSETSSPLDGVESALSKLAAIGDEERFALRFVLSVYAANLDVRTDPTWGMLVSPPSSLKTELLVALSQLANAHFLSNLTVNTFASGAVSSGGADPSLILRLTGKTLILKDFTTVLCMHRDRRQEILAQLREIYDGRYDKEWGTGKQLHWVGRMGLVAGVTEAIDQHHGVLNTLGERFIYLRFCPSDRTEAARRAIAMAAHGGDARRALARAINELFKKVRVAEVERQPSENIRDTVAAVAELATATRTPVIRDGRSRQLQQALSPEGPGRLVKQLWNLARGHAAIRASRTVEYVDVQFVHRVAADSMPPVRWAILETLAARPEGLPVAALNSAKLRRFSRSTKERAIEDLESLGLVVSDTRSNAARLSSHAGSLWRAACLVPGDVSEQVATQGVGP